MFLLPIMVYGHNLPHNRSTRITAQTEFQLLVNELLSVVTAHRGFKGRFEIKKLKDPSRRHASIPLHPRALQGTCGWRAKS